ncbi:MAG: hypothetical protein MJ162_05750 [Treponema sp.]|nr:hypothetical protein [Treponema sp.]
MTNKDVIKALEQIKTYTSADLLDEIECAISIIKKLEEDGVSKPLETDFKKLASK